MLRELLVNTLHESGYRFVRDFNNGQDAWNYLSTNLSSDLPIEDQVRVIIADIEMPQMDGHRLLKLVRSDPRFNKIPFILFSSLISEEMRRKGDSLGANGQISKPEINQLIGLMDELIFGIKRSGNE